VLEYGSSWFKDNPDARLVQIEYKKGSAAEAAAVAAKAKAAAPEGHQFVDEPHPGKKLLTQNACLSCHKIGGESVGPDLIKVAEKYKAQADAQDYISGKIAAGSAGVWGATAMPPFAHLPEVKRKLIAEYILSLE
jgi:cytochrome c551/c552